MGEDDGESEVPAEPFVALGSHVVCRGGTAVHVDRELWEVGKGGRCKLDLECWAFFAGRLRGTGRVVCDAEIWAVDGGVEEGHLREVGYVHVLVPAPFGILLVDSEEHEFPIVGKSFLGERCGGERTSSKGFDGVYVELYLVSSTGPLTEALHVPD